VQHAIGLDTSRKRALCDTWHSVPEVQRTGGALMAVYIDDMFQYELGAFRRMKMSHMITIRPRSC
jgi:hypothetical protein